MKKKMYQSIVATHFREHSSIYLFVVVLFLMGVIFGAIVVNSLTFSQKEDLAYYLSQFFGEVSNGKIAASKDVFAQSLFHNSKFIGMMGILRDLDYRIACYFNRVIYERHGYWFYSWLFSESNGMEWISIIICICSSAKFYYHSGFYYHGNLSGFNFIKND